MKLSAVIITRNEETQIGRCLASLAFCDEVIVVDSDSNDRTVEIARSFTPNVHIHPWLGFAAQKNFATSLATNEWVLNIDADEMVTPQLRDEITKVLARPPLEVAFSLPRRTFHSGQWIRYGGWYPNRLLRLYRRSLGQWEGDSLHERWVTRGPVGSLRSDLFHHSFESISDQVVRNDRYSTLGARKLFREGHRFSFVSLLGKPVSKFFETYVIKRGFLDGFLGLTISVSAAYSVFLKWAKLKELERDGERRDERGEAAARVSRGNTTYPPMGVGDEAGQNC